MKRIITAGFFALTVTVFFTGCSSLMGSMEVDRGEIQSSAISEAVTDENGENRLGITNDKKVMPDFFQKNLTEKFKNLSGKAAFRIKDGHSKAREDIEDFQIVDLRDNSTFLYGYITLVEEGVHAGKMVHCGAFYNYETGAFRAFHEKTYIRGGDEGDESFFLQLCDPTGDIFVYDNGHAYLYDSTGTREKFHGDIETFVRKQFQDVHSVSVVNAVTDGENRIYLEVSIEKEAVEVPEGDKISVNLETFDKNLINDESEDLDEEVEGKVESRILVYEFHWINSGMDQVNEAFERQKEAWISMTNGREYTSEPDKQEDWKTAVTRIPDSWGEAYLGGMNNLKVYQWKWEPDFIKEDGVTNFLAAPGTYVNFRDVKAQWEIANLFIPLDGKYSELFGKTGNFRYYSPETIKRQYTYVWEEEVTEGEKTVTVKHSEEREQELGLIYTKRYAPLENAYVESYWTMDPKKAVSLGKCVGGEILCTGEDEKVRWIQPGGELKDTPYKVEENSQAGIFTENGTIYYVEFGKNSMSIVRDANHGGNRNDRPDVIHYEKLAGGYEQGTSVYDEVLDKELEEGLTQLDSVYGNDYYTEDQVVHARLNLDGVLAARLAAKGGEGICRLAAGGSLEGFLLTSQEKGLVFYSPSSQESAVLEEGSWFRSWNKGTIYISVGFLNGEASYTGRDVAFARVYEYNLSQLCNESMRTALEEMEREEREEASRAEEEASKQAEESGEEKETQKSPLDRWNEEYKEEAYGSIWKAACGKS